MRQLILILCFFNTLFAKGQDHLEPTGGIFDMYDHQLEYYPVVRKILFKGLSDTPNMRFLVMPSFFGEAVWDIEYDRKSQKYYIVAHESETSIWYSKNRDKVTVKRTKKEIATESAELINVLFLKALEGVRYKSNDLQGHDGIDYHFIAFDKGMKAGKVWSPNNESNMKELVDISQKLFSFVKDESELISFNTDFINRVNNLSRLFDQ